MIPKNRTHIIAPDASVSGVDGLIEAHVTKVFDGDCFLASVRHRQGKWLRQIPFRFAFIDAPEWGQFFARQSKELLELLILGRRIYLALVFKQSSFKPIDPYKRLLCTGFLVDSVENGPVSYFYDGKCGFGTARSARVIFRNIELEMIINGSAWVLDRYAFDRESEYMAAQEDAQRNRRGLWGLEKPEPPWNFKRRRSRRSNGKAQQPSLL